MLDGDKSAPSRELASRFAAPFYLMHGTVEKPGTGIRMLDRGEVIVTMDIPPGFEKSLLRGEPAAVRQQVDTTNSSLSLLAAAYAEQITSRFGTDLALARLGPGPGSLDAQPVIRDEQRAWFNPNQDNAWFFSISELLMMTALLTIMLPSGLHVIVLFDPLAHYIDATYSIPLRGAGLDLVWDSVLALALLGGTEFGVGVWRFRRQFEWASASAGCGNEPG
ncbi:ABC transporter permease [Aromatoleum evansii]|uniref:ABC transporter permease n=1 Tax=Aromatoleum evansii TaxID=59406 RepID=UPI00145C6186|nr:ABC transporter permease [Aromatoleum evansii]NMG29976.1 hypothetical protein [Aromatoleum evansii]